MTLGCKVNQYETQLVRETLLANGYRDAAEGEAADLCVVNTCTVTATGDKKGRQLVRRLARENPRTRTVVMGCYATRDPAAVAKLPNVAEVVPDKRELPDVFDRLGLTNRPTGISAFDGRHRAYVKVQDGCILKCTYCIIPQVRPGLRTRDAGEIAEEVRRLVGNGYREIVLSGIHVGHYGVETTRGKSGKAPFRLWHLFRLLDDIPGDWRMRLSSVEAAEIHGDFLKAAADCERLCPQFHPSMQSGSDAVLKRMRRRYRIGRFLEKLGMVRDALGEVSFTTDVIVGFPGETDAEFEDTLRACRTARVRQDARLPLLRPPRHARRDHAGPGAAGRAEGTLRPAGGPRPGTGRQVLPVPARAGDGGAGRTAERGSPRVRPRHRPVLLPGRGPRRFRAGRGAVRPRDVRRGG